MYVGSQKLMQNYDQCLLNEGYSIIELVDKASDCLLKHLNQYQDYSLLCGPGNNGADGLSLALKLNAMNKNVHIYIFEDQNHLSSANEYYLNLCQDLDVVLLTEECLEDAIKKMRLSDVIIDAMFGFGLNGPLRGLYPSLIEELNCLYDQEIIAVDIPTGLNCNTGHPYQSVVCATQTITLSALKNGFLNPDSISFTGRVILEQLDVVDVYDKAGLYQIADFDYVSTLLRDRRFDAHKGDYGRIGMITGCEDYKGAALLSSKSAVYTGSGIVTTISVSPVLEALSIFCPEAVTCLRPPVFQRKDFQRYDALLIGSGLSLSLDAYRQVVDVLSLSQQPLVIDGDALTILSSHLELLKRQKRTIVLTPHMGEFKRLCDFNDEDDMLYIACQFAKEWDIILVLKGPYTIVSDGEQSFRIHAGNQAMASGGMGDVLAGMITSLLGQGYAALNAAILGVFIHGYAGDLIAKDAYTVIPSKVIDLIPYVMNQLKK